MMNNLCIKKDDRIWEIDAARGLMILAMLIGHLRDTVYAFCINGIYQIDPYNWISMTDPLHCWFKIEADGAITMNFVGSVFFLVWKYEMQASYFLISGICCTLSRNNLKGGIKFLVWGILITAYTYLLYRLTGIKDLYMRFSVIMCMALCHLIYEFIFKNAKSKVLLISSIPMLIAGYILLFYPVRSDSALLHIIGIRQYGDINEYFPLVPYLGWLLIGVVIGRKFYSKKISLIKIPIVQKITEPVQWLGKYSGPIYLGHIVLYRTIFPVIGKLLHIM